MELYKKIVKGNSMSLMRTLFDEYLTKYTKSIISRVSDVDADVGDYISEIEKKLKFSLIINDYLLSNLTGDGAKTMLKAFDSEYTKDKIDRCNLNFNCDEKLAMEGIIYEFTNDFTDLETYIRSIYNIYNRFCISEDVCTYIATFYSYVDSDVLANITRILSEIMDEEINKNETEKEEIIKLRHQAYNFGDDDGIKSLTKKVSNNRIFARLTDDQIVKAKETSEQLKEALLSQRVDTPLGPVYHMKCGKNNINFFHLSPMPSLIVFGKAKNYFVVDLPTTPELVAAFKIMNPDVVVLQYKKWMKKFGLDHDSLDLSIFDKVLNNFASNHETFWKHFFSFFDDLNVLIEDSYIDGELIDQSDYSLDPKLHKKYKTCIDARKKTELRSDVFMNRDGRIVYPCGSETEHHSCIISVFTGITVDDDERKTCGCGRVYQTCSQVRLCRLFIHDRVIINHHLSDKKIKDNDSVTVNPCVVSKEMAQDSNSSLTKKKDIKDKNRFSKTDDFKVKSEVVKLIQKTNAIKDLENEKVVNQSISEVKESDHAVSKLKVNSKLKHLLPIIEVDESTVLPGNVDCEIEKNVSVDEVDGDDAIAIKKKNKRRRQKRKVDKMSNIKSSSSSIDSDLDIVSKKLTHLKWSELLN